MNKLTYQINELEENKILEGSSSFVYYGDTYLKSVSNVSRYGNNGITIDCYNKDTDNFKLVKINIGVSRAYDTISNVFDLDNI